MPFELLKWYAGVQDPKKGIKKLEIICGISFDLALNFPPFAFRLCSSMSIEVSGEFRSAVYVRFLFFLILSKHKFVRSIDR